MTPGKRPLIRLGLAGGAVLLAAAMIPVVPATATGLVATATSTGDGYSKTKTIKREFSDDGVVREIDSRDVNVKIDTTKNLQGRERVHISWSGAHPSGGRASNPFGEAGLNQEYPVVILQCRGTDDADLPKAKRLSPETCWTSTKIQRSQVQDPGAAIWTRDLFADEATRQPKSGLLPYPGEACNDTSETSFAHVTPFVTAKGETFKGCTSATMPPEAAVGSSFPPAEQSAFTSTDGTGSTEFEVRSAVENESLGCSDKVACSIVVIPIMGLSCVDKNPDLAAADRNCRRAGQFLPGTSNFANLGVDASVSPLYWWAESNWKNRFSAPITFGLPPSACDILDSRAPTPFYGSELLSQAATQWAPAYCLRKDRFKWQQNSMPDDAAFSQMENGAAVAAEVSGPRVAETTNPIGYAPTAITGFAISYVVDKPDNAGELTDLKLTPRLIAKLLTQSYAASQLGTGHPGMGSNPLSINNDPEFKKLNPGLSNISQEAGATLMSLSTSSDVITALTGYIARDRSAMAFVNGAADPWGMKVNPFYKKITLPRAEWPLLDTYVPKSDLECLKANPAPYLPQVAAPVSSLRQIASAVLDSWPLVQTKCDRPNPGDPFKLGRIDRQGVGSRLLFGVTTLGDAERFGLRTASLAVAGGRYVGPTQAGMRAAVALAKEGKKYAPFEIPSSRLARSSTAYPGTMIVYTAARLSGVPKADAAKVAQFIKVSSTEGQRPGRANGQLPEGYLPIVASGPTKPFYDSAQVVAKAVKAQKTAAAPAVTPPSASGPVGGSAVVPGVGTPVAGAPQGAGPDGAVPVVSGAPLAVARTTKASSDLTSWLLPTLLLIAIVGGVVSGFSRLALQQRWVK
ncbi:hypothetical protein ABIE44_001085 [Marmoricola sp. OAE513]|uniref:hypothetical protein n=1 Tax=Marmoricola sp. OAE513 TaxID=2817894 RepID=UPI001AEB5CB9